MNKTYLAHFGIPGMKWGVRKKRETTGRTNKPAKKKSVLATNNLLTTNYHSQASSILKGQSKKASSELDRKINDYRKSMGLGKQFARMLLVGNEANNLTYDMARAQGYGRVHSWVKSWFDINIPSTISGLTGMAANAAIGGEQESVRRRVGEGVGIGLNYGVSKAISDQGGELSLQQRSLRKKYIRSHS